MGLRIFSFDGQDSKGAECRASSEEAAPGTGPEARRRGWNEEPWKATNGTDNFAGTAKLNFCAKRRRPEGSSPRRDEIILSPRPESKARNTFVLRAFIYTPICQEEL